MQNDLNDLKKLLVRKLEEYFGADMKRIEHAKLVLKYAEQLLKEEQADPYVVIPASILHDVGIKVAEEKYRSAAAEYQEKEGPPVAGRMLVEMGYEDENVYEICAIIAHHHTPRKQESENFRVVYDADLLANIPDEIGMKDRSRLKDFIETAFLTSAGRKMAERIFLK